MRKISKYIVTACAIYLALKWAAQNPDVVQNVRHFVKSLVKKLTDEVLETL